MSLFFHLFILFINLFSDNNECISEVPLLANVVARILSKSNGKVIIFVLNSK